MAVILIKEARYSEEMTRRPFIKMFQILFLTTNMRGYFVEDMFKHSP